MAKKLEAAPGPKKYKSASDDFILPIYYKGSIIRIGQDGVEIDPEALGYEPKIQFQQALDLKQIIEIGE